MYLIASQANDLNTFGKVKAHTGNEKGYAKIVIINTGCKIWAHHTKNDELTIGLMVTDSARKRYSDIVGLIITKFKNFTIDIGYKLMECPWQHSVNAADKRKKYYIYITNDDSETIRVIIEKVKLAFRELK